MTWLEIGVVVVLLAGAGVLALGAYLLRQSADFW